ncbi:hypothetical protein QE386_003702 [Pseudoxanthomonas winnipegensis]|nr:hypothetical protein [Pseudoxanthomonas winnipegensis]
MTRHEPNAPPGVCASAAIAAGRFLRGVDQLLAQGAEDAVARRQDLDLVAPGLADDAGGGGIDDGSDAAGLRVQQGGSRHRLSWGLDRMG